MTLKDIIDKIINDIFLTIVSKIVFIKSVRSKLGCCFRSVFSKNDDIMRIKKKKKIKVIKGIKSLIIENRN